MQNAFSATVHFLYAKISFPSVDISSSAAGTEIDADIRVQTSARISAGAVEGDARADTRTIVGLNDPGEPSLETSRRRWFLVVFGRFWTLIFS